MKCAAAVLLTSAILLSGCDEDPAKSVKIIARPSTPKAELAPLDAQHVREWKPEDCPPQPETVDSHPSSLTVKGPCPFTQTGPVRCVISKDDMLITMTRNALNGASLVIFINVERYHGPDRYDDAQMFLGVQKGDSILRWSGDLVPVTVGPDAAYVDLPLVHLDGEPILTECTRLMGRETHYQFQCAKRTTRAPIEATSESVSGRLVCEKSGL